MSKDYSNTFVQTSVHIYYGIAKESYVAMNEHLNAGRKPKGNDEPGYILTYDPERKSFKNALITIVFSGVFLESVLHLLIVKRKGLDVFNKYDRKYSYEDKLKLLDCNDESIIDLCKRFKGARREIVHEKAHIDQNSILVAQNEAEIAIKLIDKVIDHFNLAMD